MTQEEKAKAYDEALERAKAYHRNELAGSRREMTEYIFPELRESEEERIRKVLLNLVSNDKVAGYTRFYEERGITCDDAIAYLEKQKEHHIPWYDYQKSKEAGYTIVPNEEYEQLIKQKEQKPEKVLYIPKFRTGDLVRSSKNPRLTYKIFSVGSMNELGNSEYEVEIFTDGKPDEPRNLKHIEIEKMDSWGELVKQTPAEWSKEDERKIRQLVALLKSSKEKCMAAFYKDIDECIAWVCDLRPSWKPSEEQMNCLCAAVDAAIRKHNESVSGYKPARVLKSLYEDLQKLNDA